MKKLLAFILVAVMCLALLAGCNTATPSENNATTTTAETEASGEFVIPVDKWSNMTDEELYEIALTEPKSPINIYSISSKAGSIARSFNTAYPGLVAIAQDMDQGPVLEKIKLESKTGNPSADLAWLKDQNGEIYYDPSIMDLLEIFYPADISSHMDTSYLKYGFPVYAGLNLWYYNKTMYPDVAPINNWWDVLETDDSGKQKYALIMKNPSDNSTSMSLFCMIALNSDMMAEAYKEKYGKDIEYTYDADQSFGLLKEKVPAGNAGYEYLYRLSQSKITFTSDGDTTVSAIQNSTVPMLGFNSAGKIKNSTEEKPVAWVTEISPFLSVPGINYLYILKGNKHPAGARLFQRFLAGGADAKGEGYNPISGLGNWSLRDDYEDTNNPLKISETNTLPADIAAINGMYELSVEFWDYWLSKSPHK